MKKRSSLYVPPTSREGNLNGGKKTLIKNIAVVVVLAALILLFYYHISNKDGKTDQLPAEQTEVEKILAEDLEKEYPLTPKEVVKLYSSIIRCFYNETYTDEELKTLGNKARGLFDEEFLHVNPEKTYFENLNADIAEYKAAERTIFNTIIDDSSAVQYYTEADREYAVLKASYTLSDKNGYQKANHEFILRKDAESRWKILGWKLADTPAEANEDE